MEWGGGGQAGGRGGVVVPCAPMPPTRENTEPNVKNIVCCRLVHIY